MSRLSSYSRRFLLENATSISEREEILTLENTQAQSVDAALMSRLFTLILDKSSINFDSIPDSQGDVTKYEGYASTKETLSVLENMAKQQKVDIPELKIINDALDGLEKHRNDFMKGFVKGLNLPIILYNTTLMSILDATSHVMSSYLEFVKTPTTTEFKIIRLPKQRFTTSIRNLELFNELVKSGDIHKVVHGTVNTTRNNFIGSGSTFIITGGIIVSLTLVVPLIREMVYYFYYNRVRISDYLDHQAQLLEYNKANVDNSKLSAAEKKMVNKKQSEYASKLAHLSDKIDIPAAQAEKDMKHNIKKEDKEWSIGDINKDIANTDPSGFTLL